MMTDNFGPGQSRVLDTAGRSLDNVVFQNRRPPLTSEWNLINQIGNQKTQDMMRSTYPSGWLTVEDAVQDVVDGVSHFGTDRLQTGMIYCSESLPANTVKLIATTDLIAIVNGWPIFVRGTNSPDNNNIITLPTPGGQWYDFVFLEVWRKLVGSGDPLYPDGNVDRDPFSDNEILWSPVGTETTERVQIQYRIRVQSISEEQQATDDIFSNIPINPIGGRTTGAYTFRSFSLYGASDIGLYVAGDGSVGDATALNTVDGFVYAIPMFLVYRRASTNDVFDPGHLTNTYTDKAAIVAGYRRDRPDGLLADSIYKEDIIDFRHRVLLSGEDVTTVMQDTLNSLLAGELHTAVESGHDDNRQVSPAATGGSTMMKVERLNGVGGDNIPHMGSGSPSTSIIFKRRAFCNANVVLDNNVVEIPRPGMLWVLGDTLDITYTALSAPGGHVVTTDGFYCPDDTNPRDLTAGITVNTIPNPDYPLNDPEHPSIPVSVTISGLSDLIGTTDTLMMEYTYSYDSSPSGFHDVPREFFEVAKGNKQQIATRDSTLPIRFDGNGDLLNFSNPTLQGEDSRDYLNYAGGNYTENYQFGHEMVIHRTSSVSSQVTISLLNSKLSGYYILGVKTVQIETSPGSGEYGDPVDFTTQRNVTFFPYTINNYVILITAPGGASVNVLVTLYTGSNVGTDPYDVAQSFKFFELSKQGRGVIDTYEMIEVLAPESISDPGTYTINTIDKPIIALASQTTTSLGYTTESYFAYDSDVSGSTYAITAPTNTLLPVLSAPYDVSNKYLPTRIVVESTIGLGAILIPVLVHSYINQTEIPYNFYYQFNPYQGLLNSASTSNPPTFYGYFQAEGQGLVSTAGSGSITNYYYNLGKAIFSQSSRTVLGTSSEWSNYVQAGDYIRKADSPYWYRILTVDPLNSILTLAELYVEASSPSGGDFYEINRLDLSHEISNVIDRLPSFKVNVTSPSQPSDYTCFSDDLLFGGFEGSTLIHAPIKKDNDPLIAEVNDFILGGGTSGTDTSAKRGKNNLVLSQNSNKVFRLLSQGVARPIVWWEYLESAQNPNRNRKVFQVYLFHRSAKGFINGPTPPAQYDTTGRMYMVVISGEHLDDINNHLNGYFNYDTVDAFEMVGRPILKFD